MSRGKRGNRTQEVDGSSPFSSTRNSSLFSNLQFVMSFADAPTPDVAKAVRRSTGGRLGPLPEPMRTERVKDVRMPTQHSHCDASKMPAMRLKPTSCLKNRALFPTASRNWCHLRSIFEA